MKWVDDQRFSTFRPGWLSLLGMLILSAKYLNAAGKPSELTKAAATGRNVVH